MNEQKPRRNIISIIFPYVIIAAVMGLFFALFINNTFNKPAVWSYDVLDQKLSEYSIRIADVYNKEVVTEITGIARKEENNSEIKYTVTIDTYVYEHDFKNADGTDHQAYRTIFEKKVADFKTAHPDLAKANQTYFAVHYAFQTNFWDTWGPTIIITAVTILIAYFLFSRLSASVGRDNNRALDFNRSRARRVDASKVRFDDVAGCDEEKAEMVEIVEYLKNPKRFTEAGAKLPKGILLVGHPGTGKTLLAKAVAGEAGVPFYSISGSDFVEMFVGVGAGRVRDMFRKAKQTAPCLIFIDEIDAVGRQRGAGLGGGNDEREQTLNQLLVEMDGFEDNAGIIVIAATNREDVLDPALLRAGRFDRTITVSLPDKIGREAIFKVHARGKTFDPSVDFAVLAKRTVGFSGADIENILNESAILAVRDNRKIITTRDIDEAIDRRISGPAKSNKAFSEKDKRQIAYHEAGHAIIGIALENADTVRKITIIPRGNALGYVMMTPDKDKVNYTKSELLAEICGLLGGRSSEEIFFQDVTTGASNDIERATRIARAMVTEYGMSSLGPIQYESNTGSVFLGRDYTNTQKNFSAAVADEIDKETRKIIEDAHQQAVKIITERKDDVILIAETLLEEETITEEQILYLLEHREMPKGDSKEDKPSKDETKPSDSEVKVEETSSKEETKE